MGFVANTIRHTYIQVRYLAFSLSLFNGAAVLLSAGSCFTDIFAAFEISNAWPGFLLAVITCEVLSGTLMLTAHMRSLNLDSIFSKSLVTSISALGGALFVISLGTTAILPESVTITLIAIAGIAMAIGWIVQPGLWSRTFSTMTFCDTATHIGLSCAAAAIAALVIINLSSSLLITIAIVASPTASALLAPANSKPSQFFTLETGHPSLQKQAVHEAEFKISSLWPAFAGAALYMCALVSMCRNSFETNESFTSVVTQGMFVGFFLCALVVGTLALMHPNDQQLRKASIWLCPIFVALSILPCVLTIESGSIAEFVLAACTATSFAFFITFPLSLFCNAGNIRTRNGQMVLGLATLSFAIGKSTGILFLLFASSKTTTITLVVLFVVYLTAMALASMMPKSPSKANSTSSSTTSERSLETRCTQIIEHYRLTPREADVLIYLAYGRSSTYIAKELHVSTETVKVHIKHIYEKTGIHSRNELLNMVQS